MTYRPIGSTKPKFHLLQVRSLNWHSKSLSYVGHINHGGQQSRAYQAILFIPTLALGALGGSTHTRMYALKHVRAYRRSVYDTTCLTNPVIAASQTHEL